MYAAAQRQVTTKLTHHCLNHIIRHTKDDKIELLLRKIEAFCYFGIVQTILQFSGISGISTVHQHYAVACIFQGWRQMPRPGFLRRSGQYL
jgi:hypothetical protein